jgi:putative transposase
MKMARPPRLNLIGISQHVIQRGYNRQACFFENQNYQVYLDKLLEYSQKHQVEIHAFILMTNHVHLLATPRIENGVSLMIQSLRRYYVR